MLLSCDVLIEETVWEILLEVCEVEEGFRGMCVYVCWGGEAPSCELTAR